MSGKVFEQPLRIRWNHCDPAGIVYHPQYFVMLNTPWRTSSASVRA